MRKPEGKTAILTGGDDGACVGRIPVTGGGFEA